MKLITEKDATRKYQQGGGLEAPAAPAEGSVPAPAMEQGGQEAAMQQIAQMAAEIIQQLGPEAAAMLAEAIMEMLQGAQQEAPVFRCGGKMVKKNKKACGGKMKK